MLCSSLIACANNNWSGSNLSLAPSKAGSLVENGGFIAETENYVYFINGMADSNADNTLGTPIKGALLVAEKSNLSKTEIAVPKLFVASNTSAGLFIDGEYVYYVHSFYGKDCTESTLATSEYGLTVTGVVRSGLVWGTQFHPEKSGDTGLRILKAFGEL
jgi:hypothetical protein